ncbi:hypothetical protein JYT20_01665, partial [Rhodothermus sp. AH-315-K08]|nr:hypothetical protein [Rhodothermus sp. AH-315-K08]
GDGFLAIYLHDGAFGFTLLGDPRTQLAATDMAWGDFDGDGDQDLLATGMSSTGPATILLQNRGSGLFAEVDPELPG